MPFQDQVQANFAALRLAAGVSKDTWIPWQDFMATASGYSMSGSVAVAQVSGSLAAMRFTSTSSTCPLWITASIPSEIALSLPSSGSGTFLVDWTDVTTANACAVITASLYYIPYASALGDAGVSTLGSACKVIQGTSASELQSSSIFSFNVPTNTSGWFGLRFIYNSFDNQNNSGSNFHLLGARIRVLADKLGS